MARSMGIIASLVVVVAGIGAIAVHDQLTSLDVEAVSDDVYVIFGLGGNVGVLKTATGAVIVDTMSFRIQGERIRELAEKIAGGPTEAIFNSHYHFDHSHGNPGFAAHARIISTDRTLDYMRILDADYWSGFEDSMPNETFSDEYEVVIGAKTIRAIHPGRGHTGGDLVVHFVDDRVIHTGDLFFNHRYPNIDLVGGGSVKAWIETLDRILELDFDRVIPGHGAVSDRQGIIGFQEFLRELWQVGENAAQQGLSLEQTLASAQLGKDEDYAEIKIPFLLTLDRDFVIQRAWEEATGAVVPVELPQAAE